MSATDTVDLDDPVWPQNHDEIQAFLAIVATTPVDQPLGVVWEKWVARRGEMRQEDQLTPGGEARYYDVPNEDLPGMWDRSDFE